MDNALSKAYADADRSFYSAKAAVQAAGEEVFAQAPGGIPLQRTSTQSANEQLANFNGWPYACIHALASRIAGQTINVGIQRAGWTAAGPYKPKPLPSHPLIDLLNDPNDLQIAWSLWYFTVASLELTGRCLWWQTAIDGRDQLMPIPTSWLTGFRGATKFEAFTIRPPGNAEEYDIDADDACYFSYPSPAGIRESASPLQAAAFPVDTDREIQRSQLSAFHSGIFPKHAVIVGKTVGPDGSMATGGRPRLSASQRKQLIRSIVKYYTGSYKEGEPLILDGLIEDVKRLSNAPAEMDWKDSGAIVKARITQIFGVNPIVLGEIESANRASSLAAEEHLASTINPKLRLLGDTITAWLCPRYKTSGGKIVCWFDPYTPRDHEMELRRWQLLVNAGFAAPDEVRAALLNLPPLPGGLGQLPVQPPAGLSDTLDREIEARVTTVGRMIVDDALARRAAGKANGHVHTH